MNKKEIILKEFDLIKNDIIKLYDSKGMRASGEFANSLEVKENNKGVELWGLSYAEQLEEGRKSGGFPPINIIEQWIKDKGIDYSNITLSSLAFLIARKISKEGWDRQGFGGVNLISEIITPQRIQRIIDKVGDFELKLFLDSIFDKLKELETI